VGSGTSHTIFSSHDTSDPEPARLFIAALERGTRVAARDPEAATQAILDAGNGLEPKLTRAEVEATLPLLLPDKGAFGHMDAAQWEKFAGFFADDGLISTRPTADPPELPPSPAASVARAHRA